MYVTFSSGYCDGFGVPQVTRDGTYVHFIISGAHSTDYDFCNYDTLDRRYLLGSFGPGSYIVQVDRTYVGDKGVETHPMGTLDLIVSTPSPLPIPMLDLLGLVGLGLALIGAVVRQRRHESQSSCSSSPLIF